MSDDATHEPPHRLERLEPGMTIVYGGDRYVTVDADLAAAFVPGDHLVVVQDTGALLHIPAEVHAVASAAVTSAAGAFAAMGSVSDQQIEQFYEAFAARLEDDESFRPIAEANAADVESARGRGRSVTRLILSDTMRADMIDGLRSWAGLPSGRDAVVDRVAHEGWSVETVRSGLGVIGFVFEGRPNVFADATGVLRSGNTVVFRIGSDALGTARAIVTHALDPALAESGLPPGAVSLVASPARAAGWAMFSDARLGLAVARGSGGAVAQLGAVARQAGIPVSLHGTGGAWIVAGVDADSERFHSAVYQSLDRKVCNTLNTCCIVASRAEELVPRFLDALREAGRRRGVSPKLHIAAGDESHIPPEWFEPAEITRAEGPVTEPMTETIGRNELGVEWEWEDSPEVTLAIVPDVAAAVSAFNDQSPKFAASLISDDAVEQQRFFATIDSPFVGNGFTRWVDGQYALGKPELGLSNWQFGRLFGRGGILSGDSAFTVRTRADQTDPDIGR
ncbi:MAG: aldehyde dehydrogenase family protein [Acidimicrobiia bacterium]|nr:aldehyde dehydrogenase family protein [Acidimicrobiia bacterium]MBT8214205.1 aldehyde dehydrogenase family protein [Acidimicrobiia bacterium]NNF69592.1 aldehyde dehydrogenase family protein [Acidimicrobiia bacterium]NNK92690.1 aldehyde dehydrogenase family protein [Acidimicrobiia bacterium]